MIYRVAMDVLQNEEDACDAVQNAFCSLLKQGSARERLENAEPELFRWYVYRTARNAALDLYRKRQREAERLLEPQETDRYPDGGEDLSERLIRERERKALRRAFRTLPEEIRTVMVRVILLREKATDVAASLGITCAAVSARLKKGKKLLAARMQQEENR